MSEKKRPINRRDFMKTSAAAAVTGSAVLAGDGALAEEGAADGLDHRNERPDSMQYRKLGRTDFMCSRLVFGCGATLAGGRGVRLMEESFERGVNHYDIGTDKYYKGSEGYFAPFLKKHRDDIWVTSKAMVREGQRFRRGEEGLDVEMAKTYAAYWLKLLDESLATMKTDYVDAYYIMGADNPGVIKSEEMGNAFLKAKEAGKVGHFGISTHREAQACLEAAIETGWYSLAMIAITPAGWYDWIDMDLDRESPSLTKLRPLLDRARGAGIGLIGMKAARHLSFRAKEHTVFDRFYNEKLMQAKLSTYQRSYIYVLGNGIDVVNSDMQNFTVFEENLVAANTSHTYFA